ncbi:hypothetical protein J4E93_003784 [Alternaria ventricosa]|uniref:uncharacterized protein n=1 Tax=Alternaria ventricosa TaxID=1187951 RepID=UPI0020C28DEF|nr:uncharacterized protein J4E93_003784 [Alternaria ventricosa]KAI4649464.1 hypothetical protein J4E93_003784 [Alternaria ventricosa]
MRRRVRAWKLGVSQLWRQSRVLRRQHTADRDSVTPADWDQLFEKSPGKLRAIYQKPHHKEKWPKEVPYLNMIALANYKEKRYRQAHRPQPVPNLNLTAVRDLREKLWPRVGWPKNDPRSNNEARVEYCEKHWSRVNLPRSVQYLDLAARLPCGEGVPPAKWVGSVPHVDYVALAAHIGKPNAEAEKVRRRSGSGAPPSRDTGCHASQSAISRKEQMHTLPRPQLDDRFHAELFKKRQQDAKYQAEVAMNDVAIKTLKHFIMQLDQVKALVEQSRNDPRSVTLKQWQDAAEGTDILDTNLEAAQRMELSRRLEVGEIPVGTGGQGLTKGFEKMRREWSE